MNCKPPDVLLRVLTDPVLQSSLLPPDRDRLHLFGLSMTRATQYIQRRSDLTEVYKLLRQGRPCCVPVHHDPVSQCALLCLQPQSHNHWMFPLNKAS